MTPPSPHQIDGTGRHILVIDDDLSIRVLLQAVLKRLKFEVDLAEDGRVGLDRIHKNSKVDLVLLDLMMPNMNGYEFIAALQQEERRPHVIVFTAAGVRGVEKIPPNTICNSILKPFDLEKFLALIGECIEGNAHLKSGARSLPASRSSTSAAG